MKSKFKCFKCKKEISKNHFSMITFYSVSTTERNENEYNFCSQGCLDGFFRDRMQFKAIVRNLEKEK
jgi:hypothetical protein